MTSHPRRARRRDESGAVAVLVALLASALFVTAGLVVDLGIARDTRRQSQNAADAAALAGANALYPGDRNGNGVEDDDCADGTAPPCRSLAAQKAREYADRNFADLDWSQCPDLPPGYDQAPGSTTTCIGIEDKPRPKRVWVVMPPRVLHTTFGVLAGIETITISTDARAVIGPEHNYICGLCVVGAGPHSPGNGDITVSGASIMFNGVYNQGNSSGNGEVTATTPGEIISVEQSKSGGGTFDPELIVPGPHVDDPYADLPFPLSGTPTSVGTLKTDPCTQGPGVYDDVALPKSACTLDPGLYVILGTWQFSNKTDLRGAGVTLYATCRTGDTPRVCSTPTEGGKLAGKNGEMHFAGPTSGPLKGLAIVYDRLNTSALDLQGNGEAWVTGSVYAPSADMEFPGNSNFAINGRVVVRSVQSNGNHASLEVNWAPDQTNIPQPVVVRLDK